MLEATLKHHRINDGIFRLEFLTDLGDQVECAKHREDKILHTTVIRNPNCGVRFRQVVIEYVTDTKDVGLCAKRLATSCPAGGEALTLKIPDVVQEYWKGDERRVNVRACIPRPFDSADFNVSYSITIEIDSRDTDKVLPGAKVVSSNMHIKAS